ncbi:MAG: HIT domain-containing protein [Candidatus Liptonbacteria bacterium]|nr:HIT domain-containing protein [Candidatus Liptonbacteria bacterium]
MSELRQDLVSGDWIISATERAKRPDQLLQKKKVRKPSSISSCPFEDMKKSGNWPPIEIYPASAAIKPNGKNWKIAVIPNKYPALRHDNVCAMSFKTGPYERLSGIGHHDLVITRDHYKNLAHLSEKEGLELFEVLQKRYRELKKDKCLAYASTFFNWGESAGASLYHPHCQMLTLPIIPPHISHSLSGSSNYFRKHRRCVHCDIIDFEERNKKRIIVKNQVAVAMTPFVSREPFQIKIFPRKHQPYFEKTPVADMKQIVSALQTVLKKIEKNLHDPDFNIFIHTAPLKNQSRYKHYHWHIEILPKISTMAGFELGTGVDINVVDPDAAAKILRK